LTAHSSPNPATALLLQWFNGYFFEKYDHDAVADFSAGPIEQTHASMSADKAVFYPISARPNVFLSSKILAVEKVPLLVGIRCVAIVIFMGLQNRVLQNKRAEISKTSGVNTGIS